MIDSARLARAIHLDIEPLGEHEYRITGGQGMHVVALKAPPELECDCADYVLRATVCKHLLRALLAEGDREVIEALRDLVPIEVFA